MSLTRDEIRALIAGLADALAIDIRVERITDIALRQNVTRLKEWADQLSPEAQAKAERK